MDISAYLITALRRKKITQRAFAERIEVTPAYLNKLCKGTKTPSIDLLDTICEALGMTPSEFFAVSDDAPPTLSQEEAALVRTLRALPEDERQAVTHLIDTLGRYIDP